MNAYTVLWLQGMMLVYFTFLCTGAILFIVGQFLWDLIGKYKAHKEQDGYECRK